MKKLLDYKVLQLPNPDKLSEEVLKLAQEGYELHGHLVVSGEYQYTVFIQGMIKYEQ